MKKGIRNLAMWLVLIILAVVVFNSVMNNASTEMNYSELVNSISTGKVEKIVLSSDGTKAEVKITDDKVLKEVNIPSVDNLMDQINQRMLSGEIELGQEEPSMSFLHT